MYTTIIIEVGMRKKMNQFLRYFFFAFIVRFVALIIIGINIRNRKKLPKKGPAIIVANHNSHLDTVVLINLFELKMLSHIHPVAAADYFLKNKLFAWFSKEIIGIIPINRQSTKKEDALVPCYKALDKNKILILFPEGTRGDPEQLSAFKKGIAYLSERYKEVPIIPIFIHGLGKSLPKGDYLLVPFFCDIFVGDALFWQDNRETFMKELNKRFEGLAAEGNFQPWS
jgi:1-acyl-sn-glycerol-3-phosphate acyltransferase